MKTYSDFCEKTKKVGVLEYSYTNSNRVKIYDARIEWTVCNQYLPVIYGSHVALGLTKDEALKHIRTAGFDGNIIYR